MSVAEAPLRSRPGWAARSIRALIDLIIGGLLCLHPLTSVLALGWLTRRMRHRIDGAWGTWDRHPGWLFGSGGTLARLAGGLAANIRQGFETAVGLIIWSLPFTALWLGSWWAGWENSFNKGHEQAFVGPMVGLTGVAIAMVLLVHLPIAMAHHAAEGRFGAFFEIRRIRSVTRSAGWRVFWIALWTALLSIPLFGMRALPVFVEGIVPGFATMSAEEQGNIADLASLFTALWAFFALSWVRAPAAKAYAVAAPRAARGPDAALWSERRARGAPESRQEWRRVLWPLWFALAAAASWVLVAQVFVGQFMNHSWALWVTHPMFLLPWPG